MAQIKVAQITATERELFILDTSGNIWHKAPVYKTMNFEEGITRSEIVGYEWKTLDLPEEIPA